MNNNNIKNELLCFSMSCPHDFEGSVPVDQLEEYHQFLKNKFMNNLMYTITPFISKVYPAITAQCTPPRYSLSFTVITSFV